MIDVGELTTSNRSSSFGGGGGGGGIDMLWRTITTSDSRRLGYLGACEATGCTSKASNDDLRRLGRTGEPSLRLVVVGCDSDSSACSICGRFSPHRLSVNGSRSHGFISKSSFSVNVDAKQVKLEFKICSNLSLDLLLVSLEAVEVVALFANEHLVSNS